MAGGLGRNVPPDWEHINRYPLEAPHARELAAAAPRPVVIGVNWYCAAPGQRVLTTDLRWVPVETVQPGDELIGFDEHASGTSCYRPTEVVGDPQIVGELVEVQTDRGAVVVTEDHRFVRCHQKAAREWAEAGRLEAGDRLAYFMDPYNEDRSREAGWLAGFYDGEGCMVSNPQQGVFRVDVSQRLGPTLDELHYQLAAKGFHWRVQQKRRRDTGGGGVGVIALPDTHQDLDVLYLSGGYNGALRFLGQVRPTRLLPRARELWEGRSTVSRGSPPVQVEGVRRLGRGEAYAIGTTTRTLILEGLLSHNSNFDNPQPDPDGKHFWIGRGDLGSVRGGHCVMLKPRGDADPNSWWDWYNQVSEGICVGEGVSRLASTFNRTRYQPRWLYDQCKLIDGDPQEGTTVRAGLSVLQKLGHVKAARGDTQWLTTRQVDRNRKPDPAAGISAYRWIRSMADLDVVLGYSDVTYYDVINSWGRDWPHLARIPKDVMYRLWQEDGEIGVPTDR